MGATIPALGETTFDIHMNGRACWRNVPAAVWDYRIGGYQALKKWLSYREHGILERPLSPGEVQHFTDTARRIGALLTASMHDAEQVRAQTRTPSQDGSASD